MTVIAILLLFTLILCRAMSSANPDGAGDWRGGAMWMKSKGGHMARNPRSINGGLAIVVVTTVPMGATVSLALSCYISPNVPEVLTVALLLTALFTIYAVTVRTLCREYRKRGPAD